MKTLIQGLLAQLFFWERIGCIFCDDAAFFGSVGFASPNASFSLQERSRQTPAIAQKTFHGPEVEKEEIFLRITNHLKSHNATSGDDVQFKCKVAGKPKEVRFTWYHNDMKVDTTSGRYAHLTISNHEWGSKLKIRGVFTLDSGVYRCEASNGYRRVHSRARLEISFKRPPPPSKEEKASIKLRRGECRRYEGFVCSKYFNGSEIFVDPDASQRNIEEQIQSAFYEIAKSSHISEKCRLFTLPAFCYFIFPSCSIEGGKPIARPQKLCREECEKLKREVCFDEYLKKHKIPFLEYVFNNVSCGDLPSVQTSKCTGIGLQSYNKETNKNSSTECYNSKGEHYKGKVTITEEGKQCKNWPSHLVTKYPELDGHHFCRNPGGAMKKPWCFTNDQYNERSSCTITHCDGQNQSVSSLYIIVFCFGGVLCIAAFVFTCYYCQRSNKKSHSPMTSSSSILLQPELPCFSPQLRTPHLNASSIQLVTEIGEWEFGRAYKGTIRNDPRFLQGLPVAVKVLNDNASLTNFNVFAGDLEILSDLQHPNVAALKAAVFQSNFRCLVHEYTDQVDLYEYLILNRHNEYSTKKSHSAAGSETGPLPPDNLDFIEMSLQVASGMEYLSSNNYIHRDLAARNILVCGKMSLKISNLGIVKNSYCSCYYRTPKGELQPIRWMAPETIQSWQFSDKSTVWSFGVLLWEVFSYGMQPYCGYNNHEVLDVISRHQLLSCPDQCPAKIYSLMRECWQAQPSQRPLFQDIRVKLCLFMEGGDVVIMAREHAQRGPPPEYSSRPPSLLNESCSSHLELDSTVSNPSASFVPGNEIAHSSTAYSPFRRKDEADTVHKQGERELHI